MVVSSLVDLGVFPPDPAIMDFGLALPPFSYSFLISSLADLEVSNLFSSLKRIRKTAAFAKELKKVQCFLPPGSPPEFLGVEIGLSPYTPMRALYHELEWR